MATLTVSASKVGGSIRPAEKLCECGERAPLGYFNKVGRFGETFVTVKNVPVYKPPTLLADTVSVAIFSPPHSGLYTMIPS